MAHDKIPPALSGLIDRLDQIRDELFAIQRSLEKLEPAYPPLPDDGDKAD
jgi:hypothetical protein